ncbi:hypothetical protein APHAL10511_003265 [Amanita phalloides]|nr:hypothetical protein APHAL10511_003265 [Amanita phalloides]
MIPGSPQACLQPPPTQHMEAQSGLPQPTSSAAELPPQPYHPKRKQKERQSTARPSDDHKRERYKNVGTEIGGKEGQGKQSDTKKDSRSGRGTFLEGKQTIEPGAGNSSVSRPHTPSSFADSKRKGGGQGRGTQEGRSQSDEKGSRFRREGPSGKDRRTTDTDKGVVSGASRPDSPLPSTDVVRGEAHPPMPPRAGHRARAPKFNPGLTVPDARIDSAPEKTLTSAPEKTEPIPTDSKQRESSEKRQRRPRLTTPRPHFADDLTSTLIKSLSVRPKSGHAHLRLLKYLLLLTTKLRPYHSPVGPFFISNALEVGLRRASKRWRRRGGIVVRWTRRESGDVLDVKQEGNLCPPATGVSVILSQILSHRVWLRHTLVVIHVRVLEKRAVDMLVPSFVILGPVRHVKSRCKCRVRAQGTRLSCSVVETIYPVRGKLKKIARPERK